MKKPSSCARCVDGVPVVQAECDTFKGNTRLVWLCKKCQPEEPQDARRKKAVRK